MEDSVDQVPMTRFPGDPRSPVSSRNPSSLAYVSPIQRSLLPKFLRLVFYIGISPHKYSFDKSSNSYKASGNWFQRCWCVLVVILGGLTKIKDSRQMHVWVPLQPTDKLRNPTDYFEVAEQLSILFYFSSSIFTFWIRKDEIIRVLNGHHKLNTAGRTSVRKRVCEENSDLPPAPEKAESWVNRNMVFILLSVFIAHSALTTVVMFLSTASDFYMFYKTMSEDGRTLLFLGKTSQNLTLLNHEDGRHGHDIHVLDVLLMLANILAYFAENIAACCADFLLLFTAIILLDQIHTFSKKLASKSYYLIKEDGNTICIRSILDDFDHFRRFVSQVNSAVGLLSFALTLGTIPFFVTYFLKMLNPESLLIFFQTFFYFASCITFVTLAAKVNKKAQLLEDWLSYGENFRLLSQQQQQSLGIGDILVLQSGRNVGISAGGFFIITTEFLGAWISLILTFAIIILDFEKD